MGMDKREKGFRGEDLAVAYLRREKFRVLVRNFRCFLGEVDVVAERGGMLYFLEVKARRGERFGSPWEAVGPKKQKRIRRIAEYYLLRNNLRDRGVSFGVVGVDLACSPPSVNLVEDSFS